MTSIEVVRRVLSHDWKSAVVIANHVPALDAKPGYHVSKVKDALYYMLDRGYVEMEIRGGLSYWRLAE